MGTLLTSLLVILLAVAIIYFLVQLKIQIVPEEERLVIYRLGRFQRIAGPGLVVVHRSVEEIKRTISARDEPHPVRVTGLFINGVPFGYTLNFWYRIDLEAAVGTDRARLVNLAQFSNEERHQQVATKVREALTASTAYVERNYKPASSDFFHKVLPIIPGLPEFEVLFIEARQQLARTLQLVGAILNETQPIIVTNLHLGDDILKSFSRGRVAGLLKETFPDLAPELLLQAVSSIEGIDMPQQRVVFDGGAQTTMDFQVGEENSSSRVWTNPPHNRARSAAPTQEVPDQEAPGVTPTPAASTTTSQPAEHLSPEDLKVLKRVPAA